MLRWVTWSRIEGTSSSPIIWDSTSEINRTLLIYTNCGCNSKNVKIIWNGFWCFWLHWNLWSYSGFVSVQLHSESGPLFKITTTKTIIFYKAFLKVTYLADFRTITLLQSYTHMLIFTYMSHPSYSESSQLFCGVHKCLEYWSLIFYFWNFRTNIVLTFTYPYFTKTLAFHSLHQK